LSAGPTFSLDVTVVGSGTVTSDVGTINCLPTCSESYAEGTLVTLTPVADPNYGFDGWSGDADCTDGQVTMDSAQACTATFSSTQVLLSEDFADGDFVGWTVVDEGTVSSPSAWSAVTGELRQTSNIYGGSTDGTVLPKLGSYLWWTEGLGWTDYTFRVTMEAGDNDAMGVMFRYQDPNNYYRFSWDQQRSYRRLVKRTNGVFTLLAEDGVPYVQGTTYQVDVVVNGGNLEVRIDGTLLWSGGVVDSDHGSGSVGLYVWGQSNVTYAAVEVEP